MRRSKHRPQRRYSRVIGVAVIIGLVVVGAGWWGGHKKAPAPSAPSAPTASLQTPTDPNPATAKQALATALPATQFTGVAAIYHHGKRIATLTRGEADRQRHEKNTVKTMFEIDSVQKSLTAGLVMQAVAAGKLDLHSLLSRYYPQITGANQITLRQMLDMTSGLTYHGSFLAPDYISDDVRIQRLIAHLGFDRQQYDHGVYQPANYVLLAGILEQATHKSYQQLFTDTYLNSLALPHTRFAYAKNQHNMATGYGWGSAGLADAPRIKTSDATKHQELGTGQIFMSIDDLYQAEQALVNGPLLSVKDSAWLFAPGSNTTYGGGLYQMPQYRFANGFGYGFQCFMRITQDGQDAVIVMANCNTPNQVLKNAADKLAGQWLRY